MKKLKKIVASLLAVLMLLGVTPVTALAGEIELHRINTTQQPAEEPAQEPVLSSEDVLPEEDVAEAAEPAAVSSSGEFIRIFHLDCGRKYFSVSEIEGIINQLAANHFTHIQLAFGNNGFRFLLNDMSVTANGTTYSSEAVTSAITSGNSSYSSGKNADSGMLSESDMNSIIAYAAEKGIEVIPMLNTPGHMDALVSAMQTLGIRSSTGSEMSLTSEAELNFIKALQKKYIDYFAGKGSTRYNFAADEYSFDKLDNDGYTAFAQYVNDIAAMVKDAGIIPMCYNDGINYSGKTTSVAFDTDIQICYWSKAKNYASVQELSNAGFKIVNNNDAWYYVLGDYLYTIWDHGQWGYNDALNGIQNTPVTQAKNAEDKEIPVVGSVLCCWCDGPHMSYNDCEQKLYNLIKAMADANPDYFKAEENPKEPEIVVSPAPGEIQAEKLANGNYKVAVKPNDTLTLTLSNSTAKLNWASDKEDIATVADGKVTFTGKAGTVTITAEPIATRNSVSAKAPYSITFEVEERGNTSKTIMLKVGQTKSETIVGNNYVNNVDRSELNESVATVNVVGKDEAAGDAKYTQTSVSYGTLAGNNTSWTKTDYYYKFENNYYPVYAKYTQGRYYKTYYYGYSKTDSASEVTEVGNELEWWSSTTVQVYTKTGSETVPASTTITFKGVSKGTTYVTVGDIRYTINVVAEDISGADVLPIQLWITNVSIEVTDVTTKGSAQFNDYNNGGYAYYVSAKAEDAYGENGVELSELVPKAVKNKASATIDDRDATYSIWKGTVLNTTTGLQKYWWKDMTQADGRVDYQYVRYFGGAWAVSSDRINWTVVTGEGSTGASSSCKEQVIAYYMQRTDVTNEVITDVVDWGVTTDEWAKNNPTQYAVLDFAVQYPNIRVPDSFPVDGKTVYFHCNEDDLTGAVHQDDNDNYYRRIGLIKAIDTTNYEVYMVTVTPTSDTVTDQLTNSSTALTTSTTIEYKGTEKVVWVDDEANLPVQFQSADAKYTSISGQFNYSVGGNANVPGLEIYQRQGMLVTYYLRAKVTEDELKVHYIDKNADNYEFYSYTINVAENTLFKANIGLANPWKGNLANGDVENILGKTERVSADLSTMPKIGAQYRYASNYTCVEVVRSVEGKDVYLYYEFVSTVQFVVDFGLPLKIMPENISGQLKTAKLTGVQVEKQSQYATITTDQSDYSITYALKQTIDSKDNFQATYKGEITISSENGQEVQSGEVNYTVTIIPATTVYYEDSFVDFYDAGSSAKKTAFTQTTESDVMGEWYVEGDANTTAEQALSKLGDKAIYGYDPAYNNSTMFSMDSAKKVTVNTNGQYAQAKFTFKGTGFDVISLTNSDSGAISVSVYKDGERVRTNIVNNYYGFRQDENGKWVVDPNAKDTLYQIPVMKVSGLNYGTYTVVIGVDYLDVFDTADKGKNSFWLDAIRIYDPMGVDNETYTKDDEGFPQYIKLRDAVKVGETKALFIDGAENATISEYNNFGPNNEVYLASGQAISFKLDIPAGTQIASVQIGAKAPNGSANLVVNKVEVVSELKTATEMYYEISKDGNGNFTVTNNGTRILSLTNLKITYSAKEGNVSLAPMSTEEQTSAVMMVRAMFAPPAPTVFEPETFTVSLKNYKDIYVREYIKVTVTTSDDVKYITVGDKKISRYDDERVWGGFRKGFVKTGKRIWSYYVSFDTAGQQVISVVAYDADGLASEAVENTVNVKPRSAWRGKTSEWHI